tara:strand:- start:2547 stop:3278 length:732 start_codon:yes stop_codon:yes gene_type:complete
MIQIKRNKTPNVPLCVMNCDKPLHEKLNKYDMYNVAFNKASSTLIVGRPGQGKSSLLYSFFKSKDCLKKCFDHIFYICPSNSMASMQDNIFKDLPDNQIFDELDGDILDEIIERTMNREDKDEKTAIIIDDMGSKLKNNQVQQRLKQIAQNKRHMGIYQTFILVQTWKSVPTEIRRLLDNIFLFKVGPNDMMSIMDEILPQYKEKSYAIQKAVFDKPHQYLLINTREGRLFKKFDELIIKDDD